MTRIIRNLQKRVEKLLQSNPELRDSDDRLLANIFWNHIPKHRFTENELEGVTKFLQMLADGQLPDYGSVKRCRQKLQQLFPALRGKLYEKRHKRAKVVKNEINDWSPW